MDVGDGRARRTPCSPSATGWWRRSRRWSSRRRRASSSRASPRRRRAATSGATSACRCMAQPKAIAIAAGLLVLLAIVPGLPARAVPDAGGGAGRGRLAAAAHAGAAAPRRAAAAGGRRGRRRGAAAPARASATLALVAGADADRRRGVGRARRALGPRAPATRRSRPRSCRACASGCSPSSGLPLPAVRLRPGVAGPGPTALRHPASTRCRSRAATSPREDWAEAGDAPRRRGAGARCAATGTSCSASRRRRRCSTRSSGRTRRWCARSCPSWSRPCC